MRVLFIACLLAAAPAAAIAAPCPVPVPDADGIIPGPERVPGADWHWSSNSDGYASMHVLRANLRHARPAIECAVMDSVMLHGGRFRIELGDFYIDTDRSDIEPMDIHGAGYSASLWQRQSDLLSRSAVPTGMLRAADALARAPFDRTWEVTFVHERGLRGMKASFRKNDPYNPGRKWATFTADFGDGVDDGPEIARKLTS